MSVDLEQEVEALEANLEAARDQREELIDLLDELLTGNFLRLAKWAEEATDTLDRMKRNRK